VPDSSGSFNNEFIHSEINWSRMRGIPMVGAAALVAVAHALTPVSVRAQRTVDVPKATWPELTAKAQTQVDAAAAASKVFGSQDSARKSGFAPVFGWIPTMGTHWVNPGRMLAQGKAIRLDSPSQLMYSPINGSETLVGAAYAYVTTLDDSIRPASFDGNPMWHEHPDLAPPGTRLVMQHVWFVPSPDGAFAGHNPFLPYWAVGVTPPDAERMKDPAVDARVRRTALALSVVYDTAGLFPLLHRRPAIRDAEIARGDTIRKLMPELDAAARAKDWKRWDRAADQAAAQWNALEKIYLDGSLKPENKARVKQFIDEMTTGKHDMHMSHDH
jgi:hypothetical protein